MESKHLGDQIDETARLSETISNSLGSSGDISKKHLKRQMKSIEERLTRLQVSLDAYAQDDSRLSDEQISSMSTQLQDLARKKATVESKPKAIESPIPKPPPGPPLAKTPTRGSSLGAASLPLKGPPSKEQLQKEINQKKQTFQQQDDQLSQLSSMIQLHKDIGEAITKEARKQSFVIFFLEGQSQTIDTMSSRMEETQGKLKLGEKRMDQLK